MVVQGRQSSCQVLVVATQTILIHTEKTSNNTFMKCEYDLRHLRTEKKITCCEVSISKQVRVDNKFKIGMVYDSSS